MTAAARAEERSASRGRTIAAAITALRTPDCRCDLRAGMTAEDLQALGAGCTAPRCVCPALDAVRRRVGL